MLTITIAEGITAHISSETLSLIDGSAVKAAEATEARAWAEIRAARAQYQTTWSDADFATYVAVCRRHNYPVI